MLDAIIGAALDAEPNNRIRSVSKFKDAMDIWYDCVQKGTTDNISLVYPLIGDGTFFHDGVQYFDEDEYAEAPEGGAIITKKELKRKMKQSQERENIKAKKKPDRNTEISELMKKSQESKSQLLSSWRFLSGLAFS